MTTAPVASPESAATAVAAIVTFKGPAAPPACEGAAYTVETLSFDALYRDCARPIYNFVLRSVRTPQDAEDICQEVWTNVYRRLPTIREAGAARVWLYRIARHAIIDAARRRGRAPRHGEMVVEPAAGASEEPLHALIAKEQAGFAWQALTALQPRQRMALYLKEVEGHCYREIAEVLGCSESAVETLLFRARKGFADRYGCLAESRASRCGQARHTMAIVLDGEGTVIEQRALKAHLGECEACREALGGARQTAAARAFLPLLPAPSWLGAPLLGGGGLLSGALEATRGLVAQITAALAGKAALAAGTVAATGVIAAAALSPALDLGPSEHAAVHEPSATTAAVAAHVEGDATLVVIPPVDATAHPTPIGLDIDATALLPQLAGGGAGVIIGGVGGLTNGLDGALETGVADLGIPRPTEGAMAVLDALARAAPVVPVPALSPNVSAEGALAALVTLPPVLAR